MTELVALRAELDQQRAAGIEFWKTASFAHLDAARKVIREMSESNNPILAAVACFAATGFVEIELAAEESTA